MYCRELDIALQIVTGEEYKRLERLYYNILEYGCYEGWLLKDKACYAYTSPHDIAPYPEAVMASATCIDSPVRVGYKFCTAPAAVKDVYKRQHQERAGLREDPRRAGDRSVEVGAPLLAPRVHSRDCV